ncbi:MAG TPA: hypothetical protein VMU62_05005 [Acidobacteriaceae bacterium]|nr:hypothetical protein [Acidobacteriaceae bacterium]
MKNSTKSMLLAAAVTGLLSGATALQAQSSSSTAQVAGVASVLNTSYMQTDKHSCKGKNACKGQGADHKNACKGQGSCATDGSK